MNKLIKLPNGKAILFTTKFEGIRNYIDCGEYLRSIDHVVVSSYIGSPTQHTAIPGLQSYSGTRIIIWSLNYNPANGTISLAQNVSASAEISTCSANFIVYGTHK